MEELDIDVRPLADEELPLLERHIRFDWGNLSKHSRGLNMQYEGKAIYLVAWHEDLPIGHALLKWRGPDHDSISSRLSGCADIEDLFVHPEYRSRSAGSRLLGHAESMAMQREYSLIGLGVDVDNPRARSLYKRLGFEDTGFGEYYSRWQYDDRNGKKAWAEEHCNYLVKRLGEQPDWKVETDMLRDEHHAQ